MSEEEFMDRTTPFAIEFFKTCRIPPILLSIHIKFKKNSMEKKKFKGKMFKNFKNSKFP